MTPTLASKKPENCIIDCRISSTRQLAGGGLADQKHICDNFADKNGWNTLKIYSKVYSGRAEERKDFDEILSDIRNYHRRGVKVHYYVIKSIDRLTRDGAFTYEEMKDKLDELGVQLIDAVGVIQPKQNRLAHLGFEYDWSKRSPTAAAQLAEAQKAKDEVGDNLVRMIGAEIRLVQEGYKIGSESDGFMNKKIIVDGKKKVIEAPDPARAPYIIEMFNLRVLGTMSDEEIVKKINAMGYRSKIRNRWDRRLNKEKKVIGKMGGQPLTIKELQKKIQRVNYAGIKCEKWTHNLPIKAQYDGLVSIDTFNAANRGKVYIDHKSDSDIQIYYDHNPEKLVKKKMKRNPLFPYKWFLCPTCRKPFLGSVSAGKSKERFPAYHCARNHKRIGISKKVFESTVERFVTHLKLDPDYLNSLEVTFLNKYREREREILQDSAAMNQSVSELKAQQAAKLEAIVATQSSIVRQKLEAEVEELEFQIRNAEAERNKIEVTENDIKAFVRDAKNLMEHPSEMLLDTTNLRVQEALFGLVFEETPTIDEVANGTPKLNWVFKLSSDFIPQESLLVRARGIEPRTYSV